METLIIFDGNSILNRAYYGVRPLSNRAGLPTNAVFGFVNILRKALGELPEAPTYAVMAFDRREPTFRHQACAFYKAQRKGMPEELALQLPYAKQVAEAMGLHVVECSGFEADDLLGTFSASFSARGADCILVTGDRDSFQLVGEHVSVHLATNDGTQVFRVQEIVEKYGVSPRQLIDVKAIQGDTSDNIPGVPGIGEKGALQLISAYGDLEGVYAHLDEIKGAMKTKLIDGKESAHTSRFLAEIRLDAPVDCTPETYRFRGPDIPSLRALYTELEFRRLLEQLPEDTAESAEQEPLPGISYESVGAAEIAAFCGRPLAILPTEARVLVFDGAQGYACSWEDASPLFSAGETPVFWSVKDALHLLWAHGMELEAQAEDLSLLAYLASPADNGISFSGAVARCLPAILTAPKEPEPSLFLQLREKLRQELTPALEKLYREVELPLARVLAEMERIGFRLDKEGLEAFNESLGKEADALEEEIYALAGHPFNIRSPKQLGEVLFEERGLPHRKKTRSGYSTDAETLESLAAYDPLVEKILEYRKATKLKSTYGDGLLKVLSPDGRVHTTFKQTMTLTGRLSSAEPNLQNIPVRTEKGRELRKFFLAEEGCVLVDADYSQIELRILAHISGDETLIGAFRSGEDIHTATAAQVFGVSPEQVTPEMRKSAKAVNFGILYGIGEYSLSKDLGITVNEAKTYIRQYFAKYPSIRGFMEGMETFAREHGYVETLYGRRREVPELADKNRVRRAFGERVARNTPIQGTAADLIKVAMIRVSDALKKAGLRARLILQIHDELIVETPEQEVEQVREILEREMSGAASLSVPLEVSAGIGKRWYDAKE